MDLAQAQTIVWICLFGAPWLESFCRTNPMLRVVEPRHTAQKLQQFLVATGYASHLAEHVVQHGAGVAFVGRPRPPIKKRLPQKWAGLALGDLTFQM